MQQIKAAASVPNPRPAPKGHPVKRPMTLPSAIISAPAATPKQQTPVEHDGQSSDAVPAATSPAKSQPDAEIRSKSHLKPAQQQAAQLPEDSSAPASTAGTTKDVPQQTAQQRGLQTATNTSMLAESDRVEGTAGKEQFDSAAMQPNASKAVGHQANLPASNSQADMSEAKTSLESKPVKDSRAHTDSKDTGGKRSRGKEKVKESSKGKQSRKDKRPSRDERRRSISRSRSRSPKR